MGTTDFALSLRLDLNAREQLGEVLVVVTFILFMEITKYKVECNHQRARRIDAEAMNL